ncbi:MAG: hypothetical protein AB1700_17470 [Bacillota bacterium]
MKQAFAGQVDIILVWGPDRDQVQSAIAQIEEMGFAHYWTDDPQTRGLLRPTFLVVTPTKEVVFDLRGLMSDVWTALQQVLDHVTAGETP